MNFSCHFSFFVLFCSFISYNKKFHHKEDNFYFNKENTIDIIETTNIITNTLLFKYYKSKTLLARIYIITNLNSFK